MASNPIKWHGGKHYLAKRIIEQMPEHTRYCEPFFGGGAVLFAKDPNNCAEFVNDLNKELMNFWHVLKFEHLFDKFNRFVQMQPLEKCHFEDIVSSGLPNGSGSGIDRAYQFFIRYRQSRQGLGKDYCTPTKRLRRGMNENVSAWLSAVDGLPEAHERLKRVEIWNTDAIEFIRKLDSPETLFYCDPPYLHETRNSTGEYQHEMTREQHAELLKTLEKIQGKFILSGYRSSLYDNWAKGASWRRVDIEIDNKASSAKTKQTKTECLWMNYGETL